MDNSNLANLVEELVTDSLIRRRAAADRFRELLITDHPLSTKEKASLAECMNVLGIKPADIAGIVENLRTLKSYEVLVTEEPAIQARLKEFALERRTADEWAEAENMRLAQEAQAKRADIARRQNPVISRHNEIRNARQYLPVERAKWMAIRDGIPLDHAQNLANAETRNVDPDVPVIHGPGQNRPNVTVFDPPQADE